MNIFKRFKKLQKLEILWIDSCSLSGWINKQSSGYKEFAMKSHEMKNIGYFVEQNKEWLIIASGYNTEIDTGLLILNKIPVKTIKKIEKI